MRSSRARYFADENTLGFARLMQQARRDDVLCPGDSRLPEVPLGTTDVEWMRIVADLELIVVTRDRRIRTRPAELRIYRESGIRSVWFGGKRDLAPADQVQLFLQHERRLEREAIKRGSGPWALMLSQSGLSPIALPRP